MKRFTDFRDLNKLKQEQKRESRTLAQQFGTHANEIKRKEFEEQERIDLEALERMEREENEKIEMETERQNQTVKFGHKERTYTDDQLRMIGNFLKETRRQKGKTQLDIEKRLNWGLGRCSQIETGSYKGVDSELLRSIFFGLGLTDGDFKDFKLELEQAKNAAFVRTSSPSASYSASSKFKCIQTKNIHLSNEAGNLQVYCNIDINEFSVYFMVNDKRVEIYRGERKKQNEFFDMLEELIKRARKEL